MFYDFDYYKLDVWVRCHVSKIPQAVLPVTVHKQFDSTPYTIPAKTDLTAKTVLCIQGSTELQAPCQVAIDSYFLNNCSISVKF